MKDETVFCKLSATDMVHAYGRGDISPVHVMEAHLKRAEQVNPVINALFSVRAEEALVQARLSEARWSKGTPCGVLDGVPVLLKDSVKCKGFDYYHGSKGYDGSPALEDAPPPRV